MATMREIRNIIVEIANDLEFDATKPNGVYYDKKVTEVLNKRYNLSLDYRKKHPNVHKALNQLVGQNRILRIDMCYYPNTPKYRRMHYGNKIKEKIRFEHGDIHKINENTCVVTLEEMQTVNEVSTEEILDFFLNFLGKDNCYALKKFDNHLIIMLRQNKNTDETNLAHVAKLVKDVYENQPKKVQKIEGVLRSILGKDYFYYYEDKQIEFNDGSYETRRFLFLECNAEVTEDVYKFITQRLAHCCMSVYLGFKGLIVVFDVTSLEDEKNNFDVFMEHIKIREKKSKKISEAQKA